MLSYCKYHIRYAANLYIIFLEILFFVHISIGIFTTCMLQGKSIGLLRVSVFVEKEDKKKQINTGGSESVGTTGSADERREMLCVPFPWAAMPV